MMKRSDLLLMLCWRGTMVGILRGTVVGVLRGAMVGVLRGTMVGVLRGTMVGVLRGTVVGVLRGTVVGVLRGTVLRCTDRAADLGLCFTGCVPLHLLFALQGRVQKVVHVHVCFPMSWMNRFGEIIVYHACRYYLCIWTDRHWENIHYGRYGLTVWINSMQTIKGMD